LIGWCLTPTLAVFQLDCRFIALVDYQSTNTINLQSSWNTAKVGVKNQPINKSINQSTNAINLQSSWNSAKVGGKHQLFQLDCRFIALVDWLIDLLIG
jgi:hypothetical protein